MDVVNLILHKTLKKTQFFSLLKSFHCVDAYAIIIPIHMQVKTDIKQITCIFCPFFLWLGKHQKHLLCSLSWSAATVAVTALL